MNETIFSSAKAATGECVFLLTDECVGELPVLIKNAQQKIINDYSAGKEVTVPLTKEAFQSISFAGEKALRKVRIPDGISVIKNAVFEDCTSLTEVIIPGTVEAIESYAFYFCSALESISLPVKLKNVYENAFSFCKSLKEISFPDETESIDAEALRNCPSIERITLPASLIKINEGLFSGCRSLSEIRFRGTPERWKEIFVPSPVMKNRETDVRIVFTDK